MEKKSIVKSKQPVGLLEPGFHDLKFSYTTNKRNEKGDRIQFQFTPLENPKLTIFRTFSTNITYNNSLGQFIRMLLGNNNLREKDFEDISTLKNSIAKKQGSIYRAYVTKNESYTWNNIENIQLIKDEDIC